MRITEVTKEDGIALACLLNGIKAASFSGLSDKDIDAWVHGKKWLQSVAQQVASQLRKSEIQPSSPVAEPNKGFKVKSMGKLPTSKKKK